MKSQGGFSLICRVFCHLFLKGVFDVTGSCNEQANSGLVVKLVVKSAGKGVLGRTGQLRREQKNPGTVKIPGFLRFCSRSAGVVFDDAHDLDADGDLLDLGDTNESGLQVLKIDFHVSGNSAVALLCHGGDVGRLLSVDGDGLTFTEKISGTVDLLAVNENVSVVHELLGSEDGGSETGAIDHGIQTEFKAAEELVGGVAKSGFGLEVGIAEVLFADSVVVLQLLLFDQQSSIGGKFGTTAFGSVGAGGHGTFDGGAAGIIPDALADTTAEFVLCSTCGWHNQSLSYF